MSYGISISGHIDGLDSGSDAEKAKADELVAKAREFVAGLEGVTYATFSGMGQSVTLTEPATQTGESAEGVPAADQTLAEPPSDGGASSGNDSAPA